MATVERHRSDSICVVVVCDTDVANWISSCNDCFFQLSEIVEGISGKVVTFYICHQWLKHAIAETTKILSRSCIRKNLHPGVVHDSFEIDYCTILSPFLMMSWTHQQCLRLHFLFCNTWNAPPTIVVTVCCSKYEHCNMHQFSTMLMCT